jgi:hypothetical protein
MGFPAIHARRKITLAKVEEWKMERLITKLLAGAGVRAAVIGQRTWGMGGEPPEGKGRGRGRPPGDRAGDGPHRRGPLRSHG